MIYCLLHAAINRLFPPPLEGEEDDDGKNHGGVNEDENCNRHECNAQQCRYKQNKRKKLNTTKVYIPERKELLQTLHAGLLVLMLLSASVTFLTMVYSYKDSKARYLYFLFSYGSAASNFLIGFVIFYYFCVKRDDLRKLLKKTLARLVTRKSGTGDRLPSERHAFVDLNEREQLQQEDDNDDDEQEYGEDDFQTPQEVSHSNEQLPSEKQFIENEENEPEVKEEIKNNEAEPVTTGQPRQHLRTPFAHSEVSESEMLSNAPNSIGECSLVSSGKRNKPLAKPTQVELPSNLKNFVPENWRPARRRMNKGASYYPYYVSENAPISASLAYSSKSSSLASTTVSGVPLYKNNHPHINQGIYPVNMQTFHSQMPHIPPNIQFAPPPNFIPPTGGMVHHPPVIDEHDDDDDDDDNSVNSIESEMNEIHTQTGPINPRTRLLESETRLIQSESEPIKSESDCDETDAKFVVSPNLYIPMPHVSIKQFILRNETSV